MAELRLEQVLAQRPRGLLTDIDGTISPIAATPKAAYVTDAARRQLRELALRFDLVAAITGRSAADAVQLVGLPELTYVGNHGMEVWHEGGALPVPEATRFVPVIAAVLEAVQAAITLPGVLFEHKGPTASIHYRLTQKPDMARAVISAVLDPLAQQHNLRVTDGQMVFEIRPPLDIHKGTAARRLVERRQLRAAIFIGDDRTDADAFVALRALRERGICATLNVGVVSPGTPTIVREEADVLVDGVPGVERLLAELVARTAAV